MSTENNQDFVKKKKHIITSKHRNIMKIEGCCCIDYNWNDNVPDSETFIFLFQEMLLTENLWKYLMRVVKGMPV